MVRLPNLYEELVNSRVAEDYKLNNRILSLGLFIIAYAWTLVLLAHDVYNLIYTVALSFYAVGLAFIIYLFNQASSAAQSIQLREQQRILEELNRKIDELTDKIDELNSFEK